MRTREQKSAGPMNMQPPQQLAISPSLPLMPTISRTSAIPTNRKRRKKKDDVQDEIAKKVARRRSLKKQREAQNCGSIQFPLPTRGVADPTFSEVVVRRFVGFVLRERTWIPLYRSAKEALALQPAGVSDQMSSHFRGLALRAKLEIRE